MKRWEASRRPGRGREVASFRSLPVSLRRVSLQADPTVVVDGMGYSGNFAGMRYTANMVAAATKSAAFMTSVVRTSGESAILEANQKPAMPPAIPGTTPKTCTAVVAGMRSTLLGMRSAMPSWYHREER